MTLNVSHPGTENLEWSGKMIIAENSILIGTIRRENPMVPPDLTVIGGMKRPREMQDFRSQIHTLVQDMIQILEMRGQGVMVDSIIRTDQVNKLRKSRLRETFRNYFQKRDSSIHQNRSTKSKKIKDDFLHREWFPA